MSEERKQAIIVTLQGVYADLSESELNMFGLISRYNDLGNNSELIGGSWVVENCPEPLCSLE